MGGGPVQGGQSGCDRRIFLVKLKKKIGGGGGGGGGGQEGWE